MQLSDEQITRFRSQLLGYYDKHGRHELPWRVPEESGFEAYKIVVSELMLQQTQVNRVLVKYQAFLERFPTVQDLSAASLGEVLIAWQGLGYNRRAKFLWQTAQSVVSEHNGRFPDTLESLMALPGIGKNTAGAVLAYAYNQPSLFVETNVRTVYIHHFFADDSGVPDTAILSLLEQTLLTQQPRDFYWALMDYGSHLKKTVGNASVRSAHHVRQSPFAGSKRQVRGAIIRALTKGGQTSHQLVQQITDERLQVVLQELQREDMVTLEGSIYRLA